MLANNKRRVLKSAKAKRRGRTHQTTAAETDTSSIRYEASEAIARTEGLGFRTRKYPSTALTRQVRDCAQPPRQPRTRLSRVTDKPGIAENFDARYAFASWNLWTSPLG